MSDTPVYDRAEAERHWTNMLALFDSTLKSYGNG
jgi:dienelactone hydrolase